MHALAFRKNAAVAHAEASLSCGVAVCTEQPLEINHVSKNLGDTDAGRIAGRNLGLQHDEGLRAGYRVERRKNSGQSYTLKPDSCLQTG
jgi:hypothetical protein